MRTILLAAVAALTVLGGCDEPEIYEREERIRCIEKETKCYETCGRSYRSTAGEDATCDCIRTCAEIGDRCVERTGR